MSHSLGSVRLDRLAPDRTVLKWGGLLVATELLAVGLFLAVAPVTVLDPLMVVYPFVWINLGLWGATRVSPPSAEPHQRRGAALLVAAYGLVLAYAAGMLSGGGAPPGVDGVLSVRATAIPPGWGPYVSLYGPGFSVQLMPYQVVGYAALLYLVYVALLDALTSVAGGVLGLLTCVSCSWPVLATVVSGVAGSAAAVTAAVYARPYGLSTLAYVLTVLVLVWRPTFGLGLDGGGAEDD